MERCEDFEVKIEMRLHGALDAPEAADLASHLATCASCTAFERLAKGSENAMNQQTNLHLQTLDWDALWKRTKTFFDTQTRQRALSSAVVVFAMAPMMMLMEDTVLHSALLLVGSWAAAITLRILSSKQKLAAVAKYEGNTGELLFSYRRELEDRLRATRRVLLVVPVLAGVFAFRLTHPFETTRQWMGLAGVLLVSLFAIAYVWLVRRPPIARELQQLKADLQKR
jgi:hypothetical protein